KPDRLSGNDRIADNNQTSIGAVYRLSHPDNNGEFMSLGVGQVFYHEDRRINGFDVTTYGILPQEYREQYVATRSPLAAQWVWMLNPRWKMNSDLAWDEQNNKTRQSSVFLHYQGMDSALFSIGYRHKELLTQLDSTTYLMETVRQAHLSGQLPLDNQWALMGGLRYDFSHSRSLESMAGFQYEDCCWRIRTL